MFIRVLTVSGLAALLALAACEKKSSVGAVDAAADGAIDGAVDAAVDAAADGAVDGAIDGGADGGAPVCGEVTGDCGCGVSCPSDCAAQTECSSCTAHQMPAAIQAYFAGLTLPLVEVVGTFSHCGQAQCSVVADFNADGTDDFAGVFHYTGGDRGGGWELELVIIYSDGPGYLNIRYPYFGRIIDGVVQAYVVPQAPGVAQGDPTSVTIPYPGIRVYRLGATAETACYSDTVVHYWDGSQWDRAFLSPMP